MMRPRQMGGSRPVQMSLAAVGALFVVAWVGLFVFWHEHGQHDDSGYMLAIFRQLAEGRALYEEVFSQYGPFHGQAWLAFFRAGGFPLDHNHMALGVALLWAGAVLCAGAVSWRFRRSVVAACLTMVWTTWGLQYLAADLGHPLSLCSLLVFACMLLAVVGTESRRAWIRAGALTLAGACVAALALTKINLGVFQGVAVALALLVAWGGGRWLSGLACLLSVAGPLLLVGPAWPADCRVLTLLGVLLPTGMIWAVWRRQEHGPVKEGLRRELPWWGVGFVVGAGVLLALAVMGGTSPGALWEGVIHRPLAFPNISRMLPKVHTGDWIFALLGLVLAILWWVLGRGGRRRLPGWWPILVGAVGVAQLLFLFRLRLYWAPGLAALLWLPLTLLPRREAQGATDPAARTLLLLAFTAVWQTLGTYPIFGSQRCIPAALNAALWTTCFACLPPLAREAMSTNGRRWAWRGLGALGGLATLWLLAVTVRYRYLHLVNSVPFAVSQASWLHLPLFQAAELETVVRNLELTEGPLFTSHGQYSLVAWTGKQIPMGYHCTYLGGLLTPGELGATLRPYRESPRWACAVYKGGTMFGRGPQIKTVQEFVQSGTEPWLNVDQYELRLSRGQVGSPPIHALWLEEGKWMISMPDTARMQAVAWEVHAPAPVNSGRWQGGASAQTVIVADEAAGYARLVLPEDVAAALDHLGEGGRKKCSLWLIDASGQHMAGMAVVEWVRPARVLPQD